MARRRRLVSVLAWALLITGTVEAGEGRTRAHGISARDLQRHVDFLAADDLRGRDTGERGIARAEEYVARRFERFGLVPLPGRSDFFLDFTLYRSGYDADRTRLAVLDTERNTAYRAGVDFRPFPFSDEGVVEAGVVFAGYGITAAEHDYDDYSGLDVAGRAVLVLRHEPGENDPASPFDGSASSEHALFATKARVARENGARAMLLVTDPLHHAAADDLRLGGPLRLRPRTRPAAVGAGGEESAEPFLAIQVSREVAERLIAGAGHGLAGLQRAVDGGRSPAELPIGEPRVRVSVAESADEHPVAARNVAALLEGADLRLKDEWIVVGAHHDHIGAYAGRGDTVYNGADDNASGTAGVLELAAAFARSGDRPPRSIAFVTFTAEERGLLGSQAAVGGGLLPLDRVRFMLNLDMIGRNPGRPLHVIGDGFARGLGEIVEAASRRDRLELDLAGDAYSGNSDHHPFFEADVPFLHLFTGTHGDYHQLGDHADKLDFDRMRSIVRLAYGVVDTLARSPEVPRLIHHVDWLGARVELLAGEDGAEAAVVTAVEADSRGAQAGLREGDVVVAFGGKPLADPSAVGRRFREIEPGAAGTLTVVRESEPREVAISRARRGYLGVVPAPVDEDARTALRLPHGGGVLLRQVVADGPADRAGLRAGDVLVALGGRPLELGTLGGLLSRIGAGETIGVGLVRDGERLEMQLTLGERPQRP